jgi:hypothetical protein
MLTHCTYFRFEVLPEKDGDSFREELTVNLLKDYDEELAARIRGEDKIDSKALDALKIHEKRLSKPSPLQYYKSIAFSRVEGYTQ